MPQLHSAPLAHDLVSENQALRARLAEAEEALRAIREGEVDAVIVSGSKGDRVFSLTETENLHRLMVETMNEAGMATSSEGLLLYVNDRAAALLERGRSALLGHPLEALVMPDEVARLRRLLDASHEGTADDRVVFRSARGAEVPMHLWASRLPRDGEATICLVGTDLTRLEADQAILTQLREHQEALKASRAQALELLSQALRAREQAAQLARELGESDRRKDAFLATLAHELRNPLVPIRNALEMLRLRPGDASSGAQARALMERHLAHLVRLVDDLMDVSRITHGKITLLKQPLALASVLESAVDMVRPILDERGQRLAVEQPADALWLEGDPTRLSQIFGNLLNNASKYTEAGQTIHLIARRQPQGEVVVSVEDPGAGIPAEILPRVFEMFTQGEHCAARTQDGLGIGLTLVRQLVELHGGRVEAFSAGRDQGCKMAVYLPLATGEPRAAEAPPRAWSADLVTLGGCRVLVADDNREAAASLARVLELKGAQVRVVDDGPSVLTALAAEFAEVVILDIGMPALDGHEVARRIRAQAHWDSIQLIAMTGLGDAAARQRSLDVGFDHHLVKPVAFDRLDAVLAAARGQPGAAVAAPSAGEPPSAQCACVTFDKISPPGEHRRTETLAASLLHDLAQPLSSARCFALVARTLAARTCPQTEPLSAAIIGVEEQVELASQLMALLRGALLPSSD